MDWTFVAIKRRYKRRKNFSIIIAFQLKNASEEVQKIMPSHSRHHKHQASIPKALRWNRRTPSEKKPKQSLPQAPGELNAILGYGTSSSFPSFTAGIASYVRKLFGRNGR
jgi:hypothetical protein